MDDNESIRITDFGTSLLEEATAYQYASVHGGGAMRWTAPELFEPEEFGLSSRRPTYQSDIYSYGCICVEVGNSTQLVGSVGLDAVVHSYTHGKYLSQNLG